MGEAHGVGTPSQFNPSSSRALLLGVLFAGIACLRLYYCAKLPVNTGDLPRHIAYGLYTAKSGLTAAGHSLTELNPLLSGLSWAFVPYNYPIVTLVFFTVVAKISPTMFFAKLMLTVIEAINSWLVFRYSRQPVLALLYWASPLSIWWVSREGQFEPLQNLFVFGALLALDRRRYLAVILLALAIQVKITAVLLVPLFVVHVLRDKPGNLLKSAVAFCAGFLPTLVAMWHYPAISQILFTGKTLYYNPYYWNIFEAGIFSWNPWWLIIINQCASYLTLLLLAAWTVMTRSIAAFLAPLATIVACKLSTLCQPWYFVYYLSFLLPIQDRRKRLWLLALAPLLDVSSLIQIVSGPFGFTVGYYYQGIDAFMKLTVP